MESKPASTAQGHNLRSRANPKNYSGENNPPHSQDPSIKNSTVAVINDSDPDIPEGDEDRSGNYSDGKANSGVLKKAGSARKRKRKDNEKKSENQPSVNVQKKCDALIDEIKEIKKQDALSRRQNRELTYEVSAAMHRWNNLQHDMEKAEKKYLAALRKKEHTFAAMESELRSRIRVNENPIFPDDIIRQKFSAIQKGVVDWCSSWILNDVSVHNSVVLKDTLRLGVRKETFEELKRLENHFANWKTGSRVLLTTRVASFLIAAMFHCPFSFLSTEPSLPGVQKQCNDLYDLLRTVNGPRAEMWRADTIYMLISYVESIRSEGSETQGQKPDVPPHDVKRLATEIVQNTITVLRGSDEAGLKTRHEQLVAVLDQASRLAGQLWTQKTRISIAKSDVVKTPFTKDSLLMEPHGSMGVDEDNSEYDNTMVDFVIFPPILARGTSEGKDYAHSKIWLKAIVKIFPPESATEKEELRAVQDMKHLTDHDTRDEDTSNKVSRQETPEPSAKRRKIEGAEDARDRQHSPSGPDRKICDPCVTSDKVHEVQYDAPDEGGNELPRKPTEDKSQARAAVNHDSEVQCLSDLITICDNALNV